MSDEGLISISVGLLPSFLVPPVAGLAEVRVAVIRTNTRPTISLLTETLHHTTLPGWWSS